MKKTVFEKKVEDIHLCIRGDRFWVPLAAAQNYLKAAKKTLKIAKRRNIKPKKVKRRLIKDIKRDIKVASMFVSELKTTADVDRVKNKLMRRE